MKKVKYLLCALLVSTFAVTGCSNGNKLSVDEAFEKARNNIETAENFKMDSVMNIGMKGEGMTIDMKMNINGVSDTKNGKAHMKLNMSMVGVDIETESYSDSKAESGKVVTYTKDTDGAWSKSVEDATENNDEFNVEFLKNLAANKNIKELKSDKDNYNYEVKISADTLKELMSNMGDNSMGVDVSSFKGDMKITVSIDKNTNNYSKIALDMTDMMKEYLKNEAEGVEITKAEFIMNFSDYNKAGSVEIPNDVIESANTNAGNHED